MQSNTPYLSYVCIVIEYAEYHLTSVKFEKILHTREFKLYIWQGMTPSEREVKNNLSNFSPGGKVIEKLQYNFGIIVKHIFFSLNGEIGK